MHIVHLMNLNFHQEAKIVRASSIVVPEYMKHRLSTGVMWFDEALGSKAKPGFIAGSVFLFAGGPGSGKSSLSRQVASMTDLDSLVNVAEESFEQVKLSLDERKFEGDFDLSNYRDVDELLQAIEKHKYQFVVIDSLQNLYSTVDHMGNELKAKPGSNRQTEICAEKIYAYAKRTMTAFVLICHSTKGGDFKGSQDLEHIIDATIMIDVEEDDEEGTSRVLSLQKNRFGLTGVDFHLNMTEHGLSLCDAPEVDETQEKISKGRSGSIKVAARQLFAAMLGCTRDQYVERLMEETGCAKPTALVNYYTLRRTRVEV
jgi:predicted ATP-dependent serine protease